MKPYILSAPRPNEGFTLMEMVVSLGIFSLLAVAALGVMIGLLDVELKATGAQTALDNVRFGLELITKEMRTGYQYDIPDGSSTSCPGFVEGVKFTASDAKKRMYYLSGGRIMRLVGATDCIAASPQPFTSEDVAVERFHFILRGQTKAAEDGQPWATILMDVRVNGGRGRAPSVMNLQTTVAQRFRDL